MQARKDSKAGKKRLKRRQEKTHSKADKKRLKGRQENTQKAHGQTR